MMKQLLSILCILFIFVVFSCNRKSKTETTNFELDKNCYIKHDVGPCRMSIKRYYYDSKEKICKEFIYGGCKGVVPFETLEECQKGCGCD